MPMTGGNPTERKTESLATFKQRQSNASKPALMSLGSVVDSNGKRYEVGFAPDSHEMLANPTDSQAAPTVEYVKVNDWFQTHAGHQLTHSGVVASTKGNADVWFCQQDKKFCFDNVS